MYCKSCGREHGEFYICESYSEELKAQIRERQEQHRTNLQDPEWIRKQLQNGVPPEAIAIFQAFAGVPLKTGQ